VSDLALPSGSVRGEAPVPPFVPEVRDDGGVFERFTELARQVVVLAQEEARILKHNHIGVEHLLLGLLRVEEGLAARVLESLGLTVERVRAEVVRVVGSGEELTSGQIPFTPDGKRVLELSLREALALEDNYIGTAHVLLGLVRDNEGLAIQMLRDLGVDSQAIRDEVLHALVSSDPEPTSGGDVHTASVPDGLLDGNGAALRRLLREIKEGLGRPADGGDLLVLLASLREGVAARTLAKLGVDGVQLAAAAREARVSVAGSELAPDPPLLAEAEQVRDEKEAAIAAQDFERAANLRDQERRLRNEAGAIVERRRYDELLAAARTHLDLPSD
jgi:hypothetical protein